jgi:hypothetical protein
LRKTDELVGANGALIARYDELICAKTTYLAEQQTKRRTRAQVTTQQLTVDPPPRSAQACRDGSDIELPTPPVEDCAIQRRKTLKLGLVVAVNPEVLGRVLSDAATEAMEFTQVVGLSAVGGHESMS